MVSERTFECGTCGRVHHGLAEVGYRRPDAILTLGPAERAECWEHDDGCVIPGTAGDEPRHFLRCHLSVPLRDVASDWGWGVWVEVAKADFNRAYDLWDIDASDEPPFPGTIANEIKAVPGSLGAAVAVQLEDPTSRPSLKVRDGPLARFQREGITVHDAERFLELK